MQIKTHSKIENAWFGVATRQHRSAVGRQVRLIVWCLIRAWLVKVADIETTVRIKNTALDKHHRFELRSNSAFCRVPLWSRQLDSAALQFHSVSEQFFCDGHLVNADDSYRG